MTCYSSVSILYGLTVRSADLAAAARAFGQLKGAYKGIQLIDLRRRRSTLGFELGEGNAVGRVPMEVWEMVKAEMRVEAVTEARLELMEARHCPGCHHNQVESYLPPDQPLHSGHWSPTDWGPWPEEEEEEEMDEEMNEELYREIEEERVAALEEIRHFAESEVTKARRKYQLEHVNDSDWSVHAQHDYCGHYYSHTTACYPSLDQQTSTELLSSYGLHQPFVESHAPPVSRHNHRPPLGPTATLALTRLAQLNPSLNSGSATVYATAPTNYHLSAIDSAVFALPCDADARFDRFLRDFRVQVPAGVQERPAFLLVGLVEPSYWDSPDDYHFYDGY